MVIRSWKSWVTNYIRIDIGQVVHLMCDFVDVNAIVFCNLSVVLGVVDLIESFVVALSVMRKDIVSC